MEERRQVKYRFPVTAVIVYSLPLLIFGVVARYYPAVVGLVFGVFFLPRQRLELNEREAIIRSGKTQRVPWGSVSGVRRSWPGGIALTTDSYESIASPAPCSWWGGPARDDQVAEVVQWWVEHRGASWTPRPPFMPAPPLAPKPPVRHRTSAVARPLAVIGLLAAVINGAALAASEPDIDHLGWAMVAAATAGLVLAAAWSVKVQRLLAQDPPPGAPANARPGNAARPVGILAGAAVVVALPQWLGWAEGIGALAMVAVGVAASVAGALLTVAARTFERRTGRLLLSSHPLRRGLGLETGPPR